MDQEPPTPGRQAILEAVVLTVAKKGLRGLTFRSVAEAAGVSPALAAHHFGTREQLIAEALRWSITDAIDATHLSAFGNDMSEYESAVSQTLNTILDLHSFQLEMIMEASRRPELQPEINTLYNTYLAGLSDSLGPDKQISHHLLRAYFASIDGLILQFLGGALDIEGFQSSLHEMTSLVMHSAIHVEKH